MRRLVPLVVLLVFGLVGSPAFAASVSRANGGFAPFVGVWSGHTRYLDIGHLGHAKESIGDGCCDQIVTLGFTLISVRGTVKRGSAMARVTMVHVQDKSAFGETPPYVGQVGRLTLRKGIIFEPFTQAYYCDDRPAELGACGA